MERAESEGLDGRPESAAAEPDYRRRRQTAGADPDISLDFVVGMFALAGMFLLAALVGSLIVAGVILFMKRRQQRLSPDDPITHRCESDVNSLLLAQGEPPCFSVFYPLF